MGLQEELCSPAWCMEVRKWCDLSGAHCDNPGALKWTRLSSTMNQQLLLSLAPGAVLPSPDVLVYTLAKFAEERCAAICESLGQDSVLHNKVRLVGHNMSPR